MTPRTTLALVAASLSLLGLSAPAEAATLRVLTYNFGALVPSPVVRAGEIGAKIEAYRTDGAAGTTSIVHLQEVFLPTYYNPLVAATNYTHESPFAPSSDPMNVPFGSGLVSLSDTAQMNFQAVPWNDSAGDDTIAEKGFTYSQHELEPGLVVDIYNLHTNASGDTAAGPAARRMQLEQLEAFINTNSSGNPLILFGDTNSRWTEMEDDWASFVDDAGLSEVWVELPRMGMAPGIQMDSIKDGCPPPEGNATIGSGTASGPDCEIVDKILWRDGGLVQITPTAYEALDEDFLDDMGEPLSDHLAISAEFDITVIPEPATALQLALGLVGLALAGRTRRSR